jgi:DNA-binding transcriptional MerR regulator
MSLTKNWYTIDEAASRYGLSTRQIQKWVNEGLVRTEERRGKVTLLNGDDIEQKLNLVPSV